MLHVGAAKPFIHYQQNSRFYMSRSGLCLLMLTLWAGNVSPPAAAQPDQTPTPPPSASRMERRQRLAQAWGEFKAAEPGHWRVQWDDSTAARDFRRSGDASGPRATKSQTPATAIGKSAPCPKKRRSLRAARPREPVHIRARIRPRAPRFITH